MDEITPFTIRRSWRKILPIETEEAGDDDVEVQTENITDFVNDFSRLGVSLTEAEVSEWLATDNQDHLDDEGIVTLVNSQEDSTHQEPESEEEVNQTVPVYQSQFLIKMQSKCLTNASHGYSNNQSVLHVT